MAAAGIKDESDTKLSRAGGGLDWRLYSWEVGGRGQTSRRPMVGEGGEERRRGAGARGEKIDYFSACSH
jgi:hypothetical protein